MKRVRQLRKVGVEHISAIVQRRGEPSRLRQHQRDVSLLVTKAVGHALGAEQLNDLIGVCSSPADAPRAAAIADHAARGRRCGNNGHVGRRMDARPVVIGRVDLENTREAVAIPRWKCARQQRRVVDARAYECAKEAADVKRIVDRISVEQNEVLIRLAAVYAEAGREIVFRLNARHQLDDANHIGFPEPRNGGHRRLRESNGPDIRLRDECLPISRLRVGEYRGKHRRARREKDLDARRVASTDDDRNSCRSGVGSRHDQALIADRHAGDGETAVGPRDGESPHTNDRRASVRFSGLRHGVDDASDDDPRLLRRQHRRRGDQAHGDDRQGRPHRRSLDGQVAGRQPSR